MLEILFVEDGSVDELDVADACVSGMIGRRRSGSPVVTERYWGGMLGIGGWSDCV